MFRGSDRGVLLHHTGSGYGLEKLFDFRSTMDKLVIPELVYRVLDEVDERDQKAPRVRTVHDEALEEDPCYLFLNGFSVGLSKQVEE